MPDDSNISTDQQFFLGIDPGVRGGAGLALVDYRTGSLFMTLAVGRDPGLSTIQMMRVVRDSIVNILGTYRVVAVAREDHVFPNAIERIARNILRRMNGAIDVAVCDRGYTEGENYLGFPVGTWKVLAGLPGDLGKETKNAEKGEATRLGTRRKKGTKEQYLAKINELLGVQHATVDEADAHAIALALRTVHHVRRRMLGFGLQEIPHRAAESIWDKEKTGMTVRKAITSGYAAAVSTDTLRTMLKDFAL